VSNDIEAVTRLIEETYQNTANSGDAEAYASLYTENAIWSPPSAPDRRGKANIKFGFIVKNADISATMKVDDCEVIGDFAFVTAMARVKVMPRDGSESILYFYRGLWHVRKIAGSWKIDRQIWTEKPAHQFQPHFDSMSTSTAK
jgi:uncharacterized protein (TIGR02246 family)